MRSTLRAWHSHGFIFRIKDLDAVQIPRSIRLLVVMTNPQFLHGPQIHPSDREHVLLKTIRSQVDSLYSVNVWVFSSTHLSALKLVKVVWLAQFSLARVAHFSVDVDVNTGIGSGPQHIPSEHMNLVRVL